MQSAHNSPINYNTQLTESLSVIAQVSVTEPLANDACDLYSVVFVQTSRPTLSVCPFIFFLTLSCTALRATGTYFYPSWGRDGIHHRTSREGCKRKKTHFHSHLWTVLRCQSRQTRLSLSCTIKSKEDSQHHY